MTEENKAILEEIESIVISIRCLAMPESLLEYKVDCVLQRLDIIKQNCNKPQTMPFSPEVNEMIEKTLKLGEALNAEMKKIIANK